MYNSNAKVQIMEFILTQTGTYQGQSLRPFEMNITQEGVDELTRNTRGGTSININTVQSVAGSMLRPQATAERPVNIANGWTMRRFRFILRVMETNQFTNNPIQRVFFGYTDHSDASINYLDPNTRIYFNSETVVSENPVPTPNGPVMQAHVIASNQIVTPGDMANTDNLSQSPYGGLYGGGGNEAYMIRPEDIYGLGQAMDVTNKINTNIDYGAGPVEIYDTRGTVGRGNTYEYSNRIYTSPSRYMATALKAYGDAVNEQNMDVDKGEVSTSDNYGLYDLAIQSMGSSDIHTNTFFSLLKDHAGYMEKGYVTLAELTRVFPEAGSEHVTKYSMDTGRSITRVNHSGDSEHWQGSDKVALAATTLAQVVPSIMMDNFIRRISFGAMNGHGPGNFNILVIPDQTRSIVNNLNMVRYIEEFKRRLVTDVLNAITHSNMVGFNISMSSDLAGDSVIDIQLDNEPTRRYVAPTFSDSLFTPIKTSNQALTQTIASDLLYVVENTIDRGHASSPIIQSVSNGGYGNSQPAQAGGGYAGHRTMTPNLNNYTQNAQPGNNDDYSSLL